MCACVGLMACGERKLHDRKNPDESYFREARALYIVDGQKYSVPMGYHWFTHIKLNQWPIPKTTFTEEKYITVDALLPKFEMYTPQSKREFDDKVGRGNVVTVTIASVERRKKPLEELIKIWSHEAPLEELSDESNKLGLRHYLYKKLRSAPENSWRDIYIPKDGIPNEFWIGCSRGAPFNSCTAYELVDQEKGPVIETRYSVDFLPGWKEIREGAQRLVEGFKSSKK